MLDSDSNSEYSASGENYSPWLYSSNQFNRLTNSLDKEQGGFTVYGQATACVIRLLIIALKTSYKGAFLCEFILHCIWTYRPMTYEIGL